MSSGRLKASTNRVRTSNALKQHSIWTNAIGLQEDVGGNSAIEAALPVPGGGGAGRGKGKLARQQAAQHVVQQTGAFNSSVTSYEELMTLARSQGALGVGNRGACRICGQLGHLTKQCKNHLSSHFKADKVGTADAGAALLADGGAGGGESSSGLSDLSGLSDSDGGSTSSGGSGRKAGKEAGGGGSERDKKRKRSGKDKKEKRKKDKHKKQKKHKKSKKE